MLNVDENRVVDNDRKKKINSTPLHLMLAQRIII